MVRSAVKLRVSNHEVAVGADGPFETRCSATLLRVRLGGYFRAALSATSYASFTRRSDFKLYAVAILDVEGLGLFKRCQKRTRFRGVPPSTRSER